MVPYRRRTVDAATAAAWLATSKQNKIKDEKVALLAAAMQGGRWNPVRHRRDPVKFWDGRLINGNHRLRAVIASDVTVRMWVLGDPPEV